VEVGNAVENLSVAKITENAPIRNFADVLNGRVSGVMVQQGGQTGSGQRIRVRGVSSISLANDPIYVIDGIRMNANNSSAAFGNGGSNFSRLGDINPEEIENVEIVKGPSAATLYGTDAANGVIVITTKKGRAGSARWNVYGEGGVLDDRNWYSDNYTLAGHSPTGALLIKAGECRLIDVSEKRCNKADGSFGYDSLRVFNPITNADLTPLGYGYRKAAGLQVAGGSDAVRYFMSGTRDNEIGVFQLDNYERNRWDSLGVPIHSWQLRPNTRLLNSFRANVSAQINPQLDALVNFGYSTNEGFTSNESNNTIGIGSQAFGGPGYRNNGLVNGTDSLLGYRAGTPGLVWAEKLQQNTNRMIMSSNINWRPTSWLQTRANFGTDFADRVDYNLHMNGEGWPISATYRDGEARNGRDNITSITADLGATANYNPSRYNWLNLKTTVGTQYGNYREDRNTATGTSLPPGAVTAPAGAIPSVNEATTLQKTWGIFAEQVLAMRDRLFITGALRTDQNSAFGTNFQRVFYPKASVSWVMSDESFFPRSSIFSAISNFRLRGAYGASGVQPGPNDALRTYQANSASIKNTDLPYEAYNALGNDDLQPERSTEFEGGFESRLFSNRIQFDMTYYNRTTHDALINAIIAPSVGSGATRRLQNLGSIQNTGWEFTVGGQIVDSRQFAMDFHFATALNSNVVKSLGNTPPQIGTTNWIVEGYPIRSLWAIPITGWHDDNHDGILTANEIDVRRDTLFDNTIDPLTGKPKHSVAGVGTYRGYAEPRYLTTFTPGLEFLNHHLRIQSLFDWRAGNKWYNNTERIRCTRPNCNGMFNPNASMEEQAMVVAANFNSAKTLDGFFQPGGFVKWREASASLQLPQQLYSRSRIRTAALVFTARNIKTWSKYRGTDPESDFTVGEGGDAPAEFQTFAQPTYFILRLNLGF
jgi:TonB-linked SusC/RagA family outer membrane protein